MSITTLPNFEYFTVSAVGADQKLSFAKTSLYAEIDKNPSKKCVIFTIPGAFTNTCQFDHLPTIVSTVDKMEKLGYAVFLLSVNNADTMHYWYQSRGIDPARVRPISDPKAVLTEALGLAWESERLGKVAKRAALIVNDKTIESMQIDEDPRNVCNSSGESVYKSLLANQL